MKGANQVSNLLSEVRKQVRDPIPPEEWLSTVQEHLSDPGDGSQSELWNTLSEETAEYSRSGEDSYLWSITSKLYDLSLWYQKRPVTSVKGIGDARAEKLKRLGIESVRDLVFHFPRTYTDRRYVDDIRDVQENGPVTILGEIVAAGVVQGRRPRYEVRLGDDTGVIRINFWNQTYLKDQLTQGTELFCAGKVEDYRGTKQMNNPEFEIIETDTDLEESRSIKPIYPLTEGIHNSQLQKWVQRGLNYIEPLLIDCLPGDLRRERSLPTLKKALRQIHFPDDPDQLDTARERIKFEEFFFYQLIFVLESWSIDRTEKHRNYERTDWRDSFRKELPYKFTKDQTKALEEIESDLDSDHPMHRLLQGDVGTGKTVVAVTSMLRVSNNDYQTALMAPTEVLAEQHFSNLRNLLEDQPCEVELLIGDLSGSRREQVLNDIEEGTVDLVVGTHAIFQSSVDFESLAYVVIDEQHRFGVEQRKQLREKGPSVDMLVMSATPIPRSLALTTYGDLTISTIEEFPTGPKNLETSLLEQNDSNRKSVYERVRQGILEGDRAFFVFPAIEESEDSQLTGAMDSWEKARNSEFFEDISIGLIHGRMDRDRKREVMDQFREGSIQLLFSTTVIEVGIDVPEASYLVVHDSEHFGLAQLHQLRGRIGRAGQQAYCFLFVSQDCSEESKERLTVLEETHDGFEVSREDLKFRGFGDPAGTEQSGLLEFRLGNVWEDHKLMLDARNWAENLVRDTNGLEDESLTLVKKKLDSHYDEAREYVTVG